MISVCFQGKAFNIIVIQVNAPTTNAEEAKVEWFCDDLHVLLEHPKRCPFHYKGLECKIRKSRDIWSNMQVCPCVQNEAGESLTEFCQRERTGHSRHPLPTTKRRLYTWTSPDRQHWNHIDYILCSQRWRSSIQSAKTRPRADCGLIMNSLLPNSDLNWRK